jgi:hypothetical protein
MHFHCPAVPIYDGWARECLGSLYRGKDVPKPIELPSGGDEEYYRYAMQFWNLYVEARKHRKNVTVKLLDSFILWWWAPGISGISS